MLKRWVWPTIKCSHLTPQSIYSYTHDLVITKCLIDAKVSVHALPHISFAILLCEHVGCIFNSFEDIHLLLCLFGISFCQMDGQECLRTPYIYLCFYRLKLYSCYITKFEQVEFGPSGEEHSESLIRQGLNFQNLTRGYIYLDPVGVTEWNGSVAPRCRTASGYCNSVWPKSSNRLHRDWKPRST